MQYYRCKCGSNWSQGSMSPARCSKCRKCGSDLALSPSLHSDPQPHEWYQEGVETDNGPQPLTRCRWCYRTKAEIDKQERKPVLGLDFGNVIKPIGQPHMMLGLREALPRLKELFGTDIHVVSRVDDIAVGEAHVRKFMEENGLYEYIPSNHLSFCLLRSDKGPICEKLGATHFVDDRTECLHYMTTVPFRYALNPSEKQLVAFPATDMMILTDWFKVIDALELDV